MVGWRPVGEAEDVIFVSEKAVYAGGEGDTGAGCRCVFLGSGRMGEG